MARKYYRKLVRDRIPAAIEADGLRCRTRSLSRAAYIRALKRKVAEESTELLRARGRAALLNELVDLTEILEALRCALRVRPKAFEGIVREKRLARGGFRKRLFLEYTE